MTDSNTTTNSKYKVQKRDSDSSWGLSIRGSFVPFGHKHWTCLYNQWLRGQDLHAPEKLEYLVYDALGPGMIDVAWPDLEVVYDLTTPTNKEEAEAHFGELGQRIAELSSPWRFWAVQNSHRMDGPGCGFLVGKGDEDSLTLKEGMELDVIAYFEAFKRGDCKLTVGEPPDPNDPRLAVFDTVVTPIGLEVDKTPITIKQWNTLMDDKDQLDGPEQWPATNISLAQVYEFLDRRRTLTGKAWRLPYHTEWMELCKAGSTAEGPDRPVEELGHVGKSELCDVAQYPANDWGLYDTIGLVWEWCEALRDS